MAVKQTAGRKELGEFAPKFAELMMMYYLVRFGAEKTSYHLETVHLLQLLL